MRSERGATAVEYAVMLAMIAAVIVIAVSFLGRTSSSTFSCAGQMAGGNTCVQGVLLTQPSATPSPGKTCKSQNGDNGVGCFGK